MAVSSRRAGKPLLHGASLTPGHQHPTPLWPSSMDRGLVHILQKTSQQLLVRSSYCPLLLVRTIWSSFSWEQIWFADKDFKQEIHRTNELPVKNLEIHSLSDLLRIIRLEGICPIAFQFSLMLSLKTRVKAVIRQP